MTIEMVIDSTDYLLPFVFNSSNLAIIRHVGSTF